MKVKDKEKLNIPLKGWQVLSAIFSMIFHTVQCMPTSKVWILPNWQLTGPTVLLKLPYGTSKATVQHLQGYPYNTSKAIVWHLHGYPFGTFTATVV